MYHKKPHLPPVVVSNDPYISIITEVKSHIEKIDEEGANIMPLYRDHKLFNDAHLADTKEQFIIIRVPSEGFKALQGISGPQKFQIHKAYGSPERLPSLIPVNGWGCDALCGVGCSGWRDGCGQ
ncbi:ubiquitin-protein ligase, UPL1 [Artemisia annua]|uniref:Ubiquitin-protein ligase, UPL1 n=1 Tax=Artemisia annua TaxID=35608 RepID=A0A2U1KK31_ARTAN|nr:ubiquitin-protein ligase, UPL1 [Artemisia annua]